MTRKKEVARIKMRPFLIMEYRFFLAKKKGEWNNVLVLCGKSKGDSSPLKFENSLTVGIWQEMDS